MSGEHWIIDGREMDPVARAVVEQGRRVHGSQLMHDLLVNVRGEFGLYWRWARGEWKP